MDDIAEGISAFLRVDQGVAPIVVRVVGMKEEEGRAFSAPSGSRPSMTLLRRFARPSP